LDTTGRLISGDSFSGIRELKRILMREHRREFYRCLSEKLLTYALGRGLNELDVEAVDRLVARTEQADGRFSALLAGGGESAPFQKTRRTTERKTIDQASGNTARENRQPLTGSGQ